MKKPIFRVFVSYEIKSKKVVTRKVITGILDTFVLTSNIKEIENDQELIDRICYINKKNLNKVDIIITSIDIEINMVKLLIGLKMNIRLCQRLER